MIIKIDMEKACDRMSWRFIEDTLREAYIPPSLVDAIMLIIYTSRCRLL